MPHIRRRDPRVHNLILCFATLTVFFSVVTTLEISTFISPTLQLVPIVIVTTVTFAVFATTLFGAVHILIWRKLTALAENIDDIPDDITDVLQRIEKHIVSNETQFKDHLSHLKMEVSDRRTAEQQARDALATQTNFLATTSHELRTPLNAMLGLLHLIEITPEAPAKCKLHARTALSAGQRLLEMVTNTLEAAKLEAKAVTIAPNVTDIRKLAQHWLVTAEASLHRRSRGATVTPTLDLASTLDEKYFLDGERVSQIVVNLTDNASKFTEHGEVQIAISPLTGPEYGLEIRVRDTGEGISEDVREYIFGRFTQGKQGINRPNDGSGLGLWICSDLALLMGGSLELAKSPSNAQFTTEFVLKLPLENKNHDAS